MKKTDFKRLSELALTEKKLLFWGTIFLIAGSSTSLFYPQGVQWMIDQAIIPKDSHRLNQVALILFFATLVQGIATGIRYKLFTLAGERIVMRLRQRLYSRLLRQETSFFDKTSTGELMSRLSADTAVIQNAVSVNVSMLTRSLAQAVGGLIMLIYTSAQLSLIALAMIPPIGIGVAIVAKKLRRISKIAQDRLAFSASNAEEALSGIRTVRSFVREKFEDKRYGNSLNQYLAAIQEKISTVSWFMVIIAFIAAFGLAGMLWLGGRLVLDGSLSVGSLTSFVLYLLIVSFAIGSLGSLWTDFVSAFGAATRVFELMERDPEIEEDVGPDLQIQNARIEFQSVNFSYPSRADVLVSKNLSFTVSPGEIVALVGPSGAGKSTVTSLLMRYYDPKNGIILIDGQNIKSVNVQSLREQIAVVSQDIFLMSATIEENIRYGKLTATSDEIKNAAEASFVDEFVKQFPGGYQTVVGERGIQLSGGQKQRVAIARALLKNPKILILDEATSSLDAEGEFQIREALTRLMKGRTTFIVAHRLSTVRMAHRVMVFESGELKQSGVHEKLLEDHQGIYAKLVERQLFLDRGERN